MWFWALLFFAGLIGCVVEADESDAVVESSPLPCAEETTWAGSELRHVLQHFYDDQGRLTETWVDFNGDGRIDEQITREYDDQGRIVVEHLDGGQGLPPDGNPDVSKTWFYECEQ
jgi:hypothetical protein